jgi:hypothetical protein
MFAVRYMARVFAPRTRQPRPGLATMAALAARGGLDRRSMDEGTVQQLRELEERLLNASARDHGDDVFSLLSEEFVEFGSSGRVFDRQEIIEAVRAAPPPDSSRRSLHDFKAVSLGPDVALVTYRALRYEGRERREVRSLRSSVWKRTPDGAWRMVFHQGTLMPNPGTMST